MLQITRRDSTGRVVVEALAEVFRGGHPQALYVIRTRPDIGAVTTLRFDAQPRFSWFWTNSLQAEGWFNDSLSLGVSYAWNIAWGFPVPSGQVASAPRDAKMEIFSRRPSRARRTR